jgi:tetratricopeptide (TPR) repeat protein
VAAALRRPLAPYRRALRRLLRHPRKLAAAAALTLALASAGGTYIATRPPYAERLLAEARAAYAAGDDERALDRAGRALDRAPALAEAHFLRGRVYQRRGDFPEATRCYRQARRLAPDDVRALACLAFCLSPTNQKAEAIRCYEEALQKGFKTAEVYNDLAFCQMNCAQGPQAKLSLDEAQQLAPGLAAAHHNRLVLMQQKLRLARVKAALQAGYRLPEVRAALGAALAVCGDSAEFHADAADLCALAGKLEPGWDDEALTHLEKAHALGMPVTGRRDDPAYQRFLNNPRFGALMRDAAAPPVLLLPHRLVDPLNGR